MSAPEIIFAAGCVMIAVSLPVLVIAARHRWQARKRALKRSRRDPVRRPSPRIESLWTPQEPSSRGWGRRMKGRRLP